MKKVAVFGKPGSGKSTLSKALSLSKGLPLHQLDSMVYKPNGEFVAREVFDAEHSAILSSESWLIDGFGPIRSFNERLEAADTLIYLNLPYPISYWFVTKRCLEGLFVKPEGWPEKSSILKGTLKSYKTLKLCPRFWNDEFLSRLMEYSNRKDVCIINTVAELDGFVLAHTEPREPTR